MKIINDEINLREETRNAKQAKAAYTQDQLEEIASALLTTQEDLTTRTDDVLQKIRELPNADSFRKEIMQLTNAGRAMSDAESLLAKQQVGSEAIAAETEAIEWLLLARRGGGGGGGGNSAGNGARQGGSAAGSALASLGGGKGAGAKQVQRSTRQATGKAGRELPEEYRYGLDRYFESLESGTRD